MILHHVWSVLGPTTYLIGSLEHVLSFHILGMSSSQLTPIFQRGRAQTPTRKASDGSKLASSLLVTGITPGIGDQNSL